MNLLASNAPTSSTASTAHALLVVALVYGFAMLGFALLWTVIALAITIRTAREHLPFSLTWWSFTFPVGTCVTGLNGLALHSDSLSSPCSQSSTTPASSPHGSPSPSAPSTAPSSAAHSSHHQDSVTTLARIRLATSHRGYQDP